MIPRGYSWHPLVRVTPQNGLPREYDLRWDTPWAGGPLRVRIQYAEETLEREDINRRRRDVVLGWRPEVRLTVAAGEDMTDADIYAAIATAFAEEGSRIDLSLDAGQTWREVKLLRVRGPEPLGGKTHIGAEYEIELIGAELLTTFPAVQDGRW